MKWTIISIVVAAVLVIGAFTLSTKGDSSPADKTVNNVSIVDGVQIVEIDARGGYSPRVSEAIAGVDTVVRMNTQGTFDCSLSLVMPSIGYRKILPQSGETDIPIGKQVAGSIFRGLCSMGMYNFSINFK